MTSTPAASVAEISSTEAIIADLKIGKMVIITDDEDRENEGDLIIASEHITAEAINFMALHARGLICLTLTAADCDRLELVPMAKHNNSQHSTAFTVSIEAKEGVTTGISAADRAQTVRVAVAKNSSAADLVQPGHIFPLRAAIGGVLMRSGHTEAGCDLAKLAGIGSSAVICEIMNEDGSMARMPELKVFAAKHNLKIGTIADLIGYRNKTERLIELIGEKTLQTPWGSFLSRLYRDLPSQNLHLALMHGSWQAQDVVDVRVHENQSVLDFLDVSSAKYAWSFAAAMQHICRQPHGMMLLLNCTAQQHDMLEQFAISGSSSSQAIKNDFDGKNHGIGAQIIKDCAINKIRIMGSTRKLPSMAEGYNLEVIDYILPNE